MIPADPGDIWSWTSNNVVVGPTPAERLGIIPAEVRSIEIEDEVRSVPIMPDVRLVTL